ncbi:MAG: hypothetical protein PF961_08715 [Planctomycetota bacterium]|jgi:hypothetical protein|nr:hypothetical protein [Planctomycetota bacterium]
MGWRYHWWTLRDKHLGGAPILAVPEPDRPAMVKPPTPITVFDGTPQEWHDYLTPGFEARHDADIRITIDWNAEHEQLLFRAETPASQTLATCLTRSWVLLVRAIAEAPQALRALRTMVFGNTSNGAAPLELRTAEALPCGGTRELRLTEATAHEATVIVLKRSRVASVLTAWAALDEQADDDVQLGTAFPLLYQLIASLGYTSYPRDRFVARISLTRQQSIVSINALFSGRSYGRLIPNRSGDIFRAYLAKRSGIPLEQLDERHPLMQLFNDMAFALSERRCDELKDQATILVRQLLEDRYLRPGVAAAVPALDDSHRALTCLILSRAGDTPAPRIGHHGLIDREDLRAWHKVAKQFNTIGYVLVRQLGMGQFGRVYEAINLVNSSLPQRVAIKVDRLGRDGDTIVAPEHAMDLGNRLAMVPHIIRVYDAGVLPHGGITYHIIQLIDGETIDDLLGITGQEHASVTRPATMRETEGGAEKEVHIALSGAHGEQWRMRGVRSQFAEELNLGQTCDILTSIVLWIEEIHERGFAINDLKNGNLMLSRRGQVRGIDLDSYAPVFTAIEKVVDFKFLAIALLLFMLNARGRRGYVPKLDGGILRNNIATAKLLTDHWSYGDVSVLSGGRVTTTEAISTITDLIVGCNDNSFACDPVAFTQAIDAFLAIKRRMFRADIILD